MKRSLLISLFGFVATSLLFTLATASMLQSPRVKGQQTNAVMNATLKAITPPLQTSSQIQTTNPPTGTNYVSVSFSNRLSVAKVSIGTSNWNLLDTNTARTFNFTTLYSAPSPFGPWTAVDTNGVGSQYITNYFAATNKMRFFKRN